MQNQISPASRFIITAAAFVVVIAGMKVASELLVPFMTAIFIAVICIPPIDWLKNKGLTNGLAVTLVVFIVIGAIAALGVVFGATASQFVDDIPQYQERLVTMQSGFISWLEDIGVEVDLSPFTELFSAERAFPLAGSLLSSFGGLMTNALLILLIVVFILTEQVGLHQKLELAFPNSKRGSEAIELVGSAINRYIAIKAAISLLTGVLAWALCLLIGLDYAILWGTLAFLLNFIPTFGSLLAAIPAVLLALVQLGPVSALFAALGYLAINTVVGNIVEPRVMGRGLGLSPLIVLVSLIFWGWVLGPVGMLLSVPLTVMIKIALEQFPETRWIGLMLGNGLLPQDENIVLARLAQTTDDGND